MLYILEEKNVWDDPGWKYVFKMYNLYVETASTISNKLFAEKVYWHKRSQSISDKNSAVTIITGSLGGGQMYRDNTKEGGNWL